MTDEKVIPFPDTFAPIGVGANKLFERLRAQRATEDQRRADEKVIDTLNRFTESQKGKLK
jgi:DNA-directed RNA polymerase specialized sigma54-like protein